MQVNSRNKGPCDVGLFCGHVLQLSRRTVGLCLEDEWALSALQYGLVILFVSRKPPAPQNYGPVHMRGTL